RPEAAGLRITPPAGKPNHARTGVRPFITLHGDFEVTASYEILQADTPTEGFGVGVSVYVQTDPETKTAASLARRVMTTGKTLFVADRMDVGAGGQHRMKYFPAAAATGRLRLKRVGPTVQFLVAEAGSENFVQ